jgi:hypothetical protein
MDLSFKIEVAHMLVLFFRTLVVLSFLPFLAISEKQIREVMIHSRSRLRRKPAGLRIDRF